MHLIVGLGNPGLQYRQTRHNAGFMVLDRLAERHGLGNARRRFDAGVIEGFLHVGGTDHRVILAQPETFMNRSGTTVRQALHFHKLPPERMLVVVDDIALPCGKIRLRATGSAGGHNGLKDIERTLASRDYPRLRVGVDPPGRIPQVDYVLGKFTPEQRDALAPALDEACQAIETWVARGIDAAMTSVN